MSLRQIRALGAWMKVINPQLMASRRRRVALTQANLADLVGCTQQYISALETGADIDCSEKVANKIARRLDVDRDEIFREMTMPAKATTKPANKPAPSTTPRPTSLPATRSKSKAGAK